MKRKASPAFVTGPNERTVKNPKVESQIFHQALVDEVGINSPDKEDLERCRVSSLKSICSRCNLPVFKTGGVKFPASVKSDYINAIALQLAYYQLEATGVAHDGMLVDGTTRRQCRDYVQKDEELAPNRHVKIRLFEDPRDYKTSYLEEFVYAYHSEKCIKLQDLARQLSLDGLCNIIHPKTYKPLLIPSDGLLDPSLIPMLLGRHGFLRVTKSILGKKGSAPASA